MRFVRHVARMIKKYLEGFGGETQGQRQLERPRRRWEDNTKLDLQVVGWGHRMY